MRVFETEPRGPEVRTVRGRSLALTSRIVIEQAKGVISERAGVDLAEAFSRLRRYSRHHNLRLTDVARATVDGTLDSRAWAPSPGAPPT